MHDPQVIAYFNTVRQYCGHIENQTWSNPDAFIHAVHITLSKLYSSGLILPQISVVEWYEGDKQVQQTRLETSLQYIKLITPFQHYWTVLNPHEKQAASFGVGDLIDDLFDIYKDLKEVLLYYDEIQGNKTYALWVLYSTFHNHWADHCISAMNAIHEYLYNKDND